MYPSPFLVLGVLVGLGRRSRFLFVSLFLFPISVQSQFRTYPFVPKSDRLDVVEEDSHSCNLFCIDVLELALSNGPLRGVQCVASHVQPCGRDISVQVPLFVLLFCLLLSLFRSVGDIINLSRLLWELNADVTRGRDVNGACGYHIFKQDMAKVMYIETALATPICMIGYLEASQSASKLIISNQPLDCSL
ncbi:hypothetical protein BJX96DRAFT_125022 [Aspergillus floccosus]